MVSSSITARPLAPLLLGVALLITSASGRLLGSSATDASPAISAPTITAIGGDGQIGMPAADPRGSGC